MPFFAALSVHPDTHNALAEVTAGAAAALQGPPDLALLFFSPSHAAALQNQPGELRQRLGARCLVGCGSESLIGNDQEIEQPPALCLWLARWERPVQLAPFHVRAEPAPDGPRFAGLPEDIAQADPRQSAMLLLGDPFSFPAHEFLEQLNQRHPGLPVMGRLAGCRPGPGSCRLLLDDDWRTHGAVGVLIAGSIPLSCLVAPGCRPVGRPFRVTQAQENVLLELDGQPPLTRLQEVMAELGPHDRQLWQRGLHVGRLVEEHSGLDEPAAFLTRGTLRLDRTTGALTIDDRCRAGDQVQFLVQDPTRAGATLHSLLRNAHNVNQGKPGGALLFTCSSRGTRLFPQPHHDAGVARAELGKVPLAGFFAGGEIGPLGGRNYFHTLTAVVVLWGD